ncbi:MAG: hypothetical protein K6E29_01480 [Cyanobacteria bacterium RUI128]|nr:hypothetical protein [Cyanobacteria bacterium RUI128]
MFYSYHEDYQYDSCISKGICSINPRTSSLREVLVMYLKQLAFYTLQLKHLGVKNNSTEDIILNTLSGLMSNLETGNKQFYQTLINLKTIIIESVETYERICRERNITPKLIKTNIKLNKKDNITDLIQLGEKEFTKKLKSVSEEKRNLYEIIFLILKSICINLVELKSYDLNDECGYTEILHLLNTINYPEISAKILTKKIDNAVKTDYILYKKLHDARTERFGNQEKAEVSYTTYPNKAILVAGTNIQELKKILDASSGKNIDIYTHGDMITAYTYPKFREYPHLKGQFGKGIENCLLDFATFPGAILIAKHSLENIEYLYRGRLFTTDNFVPQGVIQVKDDDYTQLINSALAARGFKHGRERESIKIGCSDFDLGKILDSIIKNIKNYKNIIIIGSEEHTQEQKNYFNHLLRYTKKDTLVISLSAEHSAENFININSVPDFYIIFKIWDRLKPYTEKNKINVSLFLAKCNKHTISNLLNMKRLGMNNIFLSKCTPVMLNPTLTHTLHTQYGINPTTTPVEDGKRIGL